MKNNKFIRIDIFKGIFSQFPVDIMYEIVESDE